MLQLRSKRNLSCVKHKAVLKQALLLVKPSLSPINTGASSYEINSISTVDGRMVSDEFASYTYDAAGLITGITQNLWASKTVTQTYTEANPVNYSDPLGLRMMSGIRDWIYGPSGLPFLPGSSRNQQALSDRFEPAPALTSPVMTFPGNPITTIIDIIVATPPTPNVSFAPPPAPPAADTQLCLVDCVRERQACTALCTRARFDSDMPNVGSM